MRSSYVNGPGTADLYTLSLHDALPILQNFGSSREVLIRMHLEKNQSSADLSRKVIEDRKSTRLNSSHVEISYAVLCLKKTAKHAFPHCSRAAASSHRAA